MRLADDDRARVPFALVAVILLVGSASYAATLSHRPTQPGRPDEISAMNRIDGGIATAVDRGTKRAGATAAEAPVLEPANTSGGNVLNETDTFRDYLRIRIYLAIREDLASTTVTVGQARAVASLPETRDAEALRAAKRRINLTRVGGGLRVEIENVTITLARDGRVVDRRNRTVVQTVATPVLDVHERVQRYERRLNNGPTDGPGLGRRMTARMNAIGWTRGYAQYGGAPISNVVANRHVELMTNGALLSTQRTVFGRSDPAGRQATAQAADIVGATDVMMAGQSTVDTIDAVPQRPEHPSDSAPPGLPGPTRPPTAATENVTIDVGLSADRAFSSLMTNESDTALDDVVTDVYSADVKPVGASQLVASSHVQPDRPSGANWTVAGDRSSRTVRDRSATGDGPSLRVDDGWHRLRTDTRRVIVTKTIERRWTRGDGRDHEVRVTTSTEVQTYFVTVSLVGRHGTSEYAPGRPIDTVHERGGPLDGPNLRDVSETAIERIERRLEDPDELARRVVIDDIDDGAVHVVGNRPTGLEDWLYDDLADLRDTVADVTESVPRARIGTGEVNPPAILAQRLRNRQRSLVDAPTSYGSVAEKTRTAARNAYLSIVIARLEERAAEFRGASSRLDEVLADHGVSPDALSSSLDVGTTVDQPAAHPVATGGPLGPTNATVAASPAYLTLSQVTHDQVSAVPPGEQYHPLVARNTNIFTAPYGDAADGVVGHLFGPEDRTSLESAAQALRSANRTLEQRHDPDLAHRRDELQSAVGESLAFIRFRLAASLAKNDELTLAEGRAVVRDGFRQWDATDGRALAAANGSLAVAVASAAANRLDDRSERRSDWLTLRVALAEARSNKSARPKQSTVDQSSSATREISEQIVASTIDRGTEATASAVRRKLDRDVVYPPAGLPVAPVPGYWYATLNVWLVTARGEYVRFAVSVPDGRPGQDLTYARERGQIALDWDGDGDEELLGQSTRVAFDASTAVVVVVPPSGPGVGDRDGNADERSGGWPDPSDAEHRVTTTSRRGV